jgi:HAD superfamily hydrolase (TIGR01490 family)
VIEAAFFDLDKTLLPGSSLFPIAREMFRRRLLSPAQIARFATDQIAFRVLGTEDPKKIERAREGALEGVKGRRRDEVQDVGRGIVRRELAPRFYPQALELIARHQRLGRRVYVCSSSPEDLLVLLAEDLGLDGVLGTRAKVDAEGVYTGELDGELCHREEKARRVTEVAAADGIDLAQSYAYSDSLNDLPLLELVGNPVATNPDRSLFALARRRGWPVLDFRIARRRALIASAAGGTAAAAGGLGYAIGYAFGRSRTRRRFLLAR